MRKMVSALALGAAMSIGSAQASASIWVEFAIVGSSSEPGTVTGRLEFADAGVGVQAIAANIDSAPSSIILTRDDNLISALHGTNIFTVTADGNITAANLNLSGSDPLQHNGGTFFQLNAYGTYNDYEVDYNYPYPFGSSFGAVSNSAGFSGVTYTPEATAAVPEPAAWTMMIAGFGLVGGMMRFRKRDAKVSFA